MTPQLQRVRADLKSCLARSIGFAAGAVVIGFSDRFISLVKRPFQIRTAKKKQIETGLVLIRILKVDPPRRFLADQTPIQLGNEVGHQQRVEPHIAGYLVQAGIETGKRRVVIALREREGRTLPFVGKNEGEGVALVNENVSRMATISADEASHWDELQMGYTVRKLFPDL